MRQDQDDIILTRFEEALTLSELSASTIVTVAPPMGVRFPDWCDNGAEVVRVYTRTPSEVLGIARTLGSMRPGMRLVCVPT